jgi:Cu2+-exporting ATPase
VSPAELRVDDLVIVRPGGSVPADGMIVDGSAAMDESILTKPGFTDEPGVLNALK